MSDRVPPPPRRRIAGETPAPMPTKPTPSAKKKTDAKKSAPQVPAAKKASAQKPAPHTPVAKQAAAAKKTPAPTMEAPVDAAARVARPAARSSTSTASRRSVVAVTVATLVLIAGAAVGVLGFRSWSGTSLADSRSQAVSAASSAAETIFTFSFDKLDEHTTDSKALMTPAYAKQFDAVAPALTDIAPERQIKVRSVTRDAAALPCGDECSTSKASVLVFLDQDRRLADDPTATVFGNRIVVEMVKTDGEWLVSDIRAL